MIIEVKEGTKVKFIGPIDGISKFLKLEINEIYIIKRDDGEYIWLDLDKEACISSRRFELVDKNLKLEDILYAEDIEPEKWMDSELTGKIKKVVSFGDFHGEVDLNIK